MNNSNPLRWQSFVDECTGSGEWLVGLAERDFEGSRWLQPTDRFDQRVRRGATIENSRVYSIIQASLRDAIASTRSRGLKPTATIIESLRDRIAENAICGTMHFVGKEEDLSPLYRGDLSP